ncbi:uncharacterized protein FOMMEDRAFT_20075 [Fomitiporia mediterranea MF3/22]|uniref:uncharacterized protein n=1 Tax=Fomitiporia mediterranea (strain MF3/22) TaxID=694068 RepID=UPI000440910D|nr:uncharacterized protein FOMMEDRAFT_20075 [Fomitiporia mediterranea MF3/22]EJD02828.1 hypothetical protein FOMMEDRAFT_20075 [Fomitiporia mediterranea MF3/22]
MILLEVVDAERRKVVAALTGSDEGPSRRRNDVVRQPEASGSGTDPPDYATSQAQAENQKGDEEDLKKPATAKRWTDRRLGRFIVYALIIYLVLSISIAVPLYIVLRNNERKNAFNNAENWMKEGAPPPPPPPDVLPTDVLASPFFYGYPLNCNNWTYVAASGPDNGFYTLQYSLPLNEAVYVRSNFSDLDDEGDIFSPMTGNIRVSVGNDTSQTNATVTVKMKDIGPATNESSTCLMGGNGTWGVAIFVPNNPDEYKFFFDVDFVLPPHYDHPLGTLATFMPLSNQSFSSLDAYPDLGDLDVRGSLGSINIESVHANNILVKTSASSITGTFNASNTLRLETVLRPITANISMYNDGFESPPSIIDVMTGNNSVNLSVTLYGPMNASAYCSPTFMSNVRTFSGPIDAAYYHDSSLLSSVLYARTSSSFEPARVFVDRIFEGTYDVQTTLSDAIVNQSSDLVDPSGAGRNRQYQLDYTSPTRSYGWVGWGLRPSDKRFWQQGHIEVESSLANAELQLTDIPYYGGDNDDDDKVSMVKSPKDDKDPHR